MSGRYPTENYPAAWENSSKYLPKGKRSIVDSLPAVAMKDVG
jgi:hypothetical protein